MKYERNCLWCLSNEGHSISLCMLCIIKGAVNVCPCFVMCTCIFVEYSCLCCVYVAPQEEQPMLPLLVMGILIKKAKK